MIDKNVTIHPENITTPESSRKTRDGTSPDKVREKRENEIQT